MPTVDRDLEEIVEFCKKFDTEYLQKMETSAQNLKKLSGQIVDALYDSPYATTASDTVTTTADKIFQAVQQGEQRIREIQRKTEEQIEERDRFR